MALERLKLIVDAIYNGDRVLPRVAEDLEKVEEASKGSGLRFTELLSAVTLVRQTFRDVPAMFSAAYKAIGEGADLIAAEDKFDRLAESIGTTGNALMGDLRTATRGMVTDADLVTGAVDLMGLELAKTHEHAVRMSRVVGELDMDMGHLATTLDHETTVRFADLGLSVDGFDEKLQALIDTGMDTNAAFTEAFLQQAEERIEFTGETADTAAGQMDALETAIINVKNAAKGGFVEGLSDSIATMSDSADGINATTDEIRLASEAIGRAFVPAAIRATEMAFPGLIGGFEALIGFLADTQKEFAITELSGDSYFDNITAGVVTLGAALARLDRSGQGRERGMLSALDIGHTRDAMREYGQALGEAAAQGEKFAATSVQSVVASLKEQAAAFERTQDRIEKQNLAFSNYYNAALTAGAGAELLAQDIDNLGTHVWTTSNQTAEQAEELEWLQRQYDSVANSLRRYQLGLTGTGDDEEKRAEKLAEMNGQLATLAALMGPLTNAGETMHTATVKATLSEEALARALYESVAAEDASAQQLAILGGALGLYSEEAVNAALKTAIIQEAIDRMAAEAMEDGKLTREEMRLIVGSVQELSNTFDNMPNVVSINIEENADEALEAAKRYEAYLDELHNKTIDTHINTHGGVVDPQSGNVLTQHHGGSWEVGGSGGTDSRLVQFWATPGERVTVTPTHGPKREGMQTLPAQPVTYNIYAGTEAAMAVALA